MSTQSQLVCRLCGGHVLEIKGYLARVNAKGVPGIWECRPSCAANLSPDAALLAAIEGADGTEGSDPFPQPEGELGVILALKRQNAELLAACRLAAEHHQGASSVPGRALRAAIAMAEGRES